MTLNSVGTAAMEMVKDAKFQLSRGAGHVLARTRAHMHSHAQLTRTQTLTWRTLMHLHSSPSTSPPHTRGCTRRVSVRYQRGPPRGHPRPRPRGPRPLHQDLHRRVPQGDGAPRPSHHDLSHCLRLPPWH
jgi:hypothetical protein